MTRFLKNLIGIIVSIATFSAYAENISGTYVSRYSNIAILIQIVESKNHALTGRFEQVTLSSDGKKIQTMNAAISGVIGGDTIVLTIKPAELLGGTIPTSGTIRGDLLHITGGSGNSTFDFNLARSNEAEFNQQTLALTVAARKNVTDHENAMRLNKTITTIGKLRKFSSYVEATAIPLLNKDSSRFRKITESMQSNLDREKMAGNSYTHVQIAYKLTQAYYAAALIDTQVNQYKSSFISATHKIAENFKDINIYCKEFSASQVCKTYAEAYAQYMQRFKLNNQAFQEVETVWEQEHAKQKALTKQANDLENN